MPVYSLPTESKNYQQKFQKLYPVVISSELLGSIAEDGTTTMSYWVKAKC